MSELVSGLPVLRDIDGLFCNHNKAHRLPADRSTFFRPIRAVAGEIACENMLQLTGIADAEFKLAALALAAETNTHTGVVNHEWWMVHDPEGQYRGGIFETSFDSPDDYTLVAEVSRITPARQVFRPKKIRAINSGLNKYRGGPSVTGYMWSDGAHRQISQTIDPLSFTKINKIHDIDLCLVNRR